jgi:hypothetical protein
MLRRVAAQKLEDVSEVLTASIIRNLLEAVVQFRFVQGLRRPQCEDHYSPPSSAVIKNW